MLLNTKARAFVWEPVKVFGRQYQWSSSYSPTTAMALAFVQEKPLGCLNLWYDSQGDFYFLTVLLCIQISKTKDYASRTCYRCPATGRQKIVLELMHFSLEKWLICGNRKMQIKIQFSPLYEQWVMFHTRCHQKSLSDLISFPEDIIILFQLRGNMTNSGWSILLRQLQYTLLEYNI